MSGRGAGRHLLDMMRYCIPKMAQEFEPNIPWTDSTVRYTRNRWSKTPYSEQKPLKAAVAVLGCELLLRFWVEQADLVKRDSLLLRELNDRLLVGERIRS